jgi:hypothetical protein
MKCTAQDSLNRNCKPVEGKYDGKQQFYCATCGKKMNPSDQGGM